MFISLWGVLCQGAFVLFPPLLDENLKFHMNGISGLFFLIPSFTILMSDSVRYICWIWFNLKKKMVYMRHVRQYFNFLRYWHFFTLIHFYTFLTYNVVACAVIWNFIFIIFF
jgi:hypothetical protein